MKVFIKFLKIMMLLMVIINIVVPIKVDAVKGERETWDVSNFSGLEENGKLGGVGETTKRIVGTIINVIRIVGTGVAIIMLTYVAIKYMSAAPSEKAEFKKSATAYIVGAIVLFATTGILNIIANFATANIVTK